MWTFFAHLLIDLFHATLSTLNGALYIHLFWLFPHFVSDEHFAFLRRYFVQTQLHHHININCIKCYTVSDEEVHCTRFVPSVPNVSISSCASHLCLLIDMLRNVCMMSPQDQSCTFNDKSTHCTFGRKKF